MITPWYWKLNTKIRNFIVKLTHHKYGCCDSVWHNCDKCKKI